MRLKRVRIGLDEETFLWLQRRAYRENRSISCVLHDIVFGPSNGEEAEGSRTWRPKRRTAQTTDQTEKRLSRVLERRNDPALRKHSRDPTPRRDGSK